MTNEECRDQANKAIERGDYVMAVCWIQTAAARTIGHNKTARYEAWAEQLTKEHNIPSKLVRYAKDEEAV